MDTELMSKLCHEMNIAVLEKIREDAFLLVGGQEKWLDLICPPVRDEEKKLYPINGFTFLETFIEDANYFWKKKQDGALRSGLWVESDTDGKELIFEATAFYMSGKHILIIQKDSDVFSEKQRLLQAGRNLALNYHTLEKKERKVQQDKDLLEEMVKERTLELKEANTKLTRELHERERLEKERAQMIMQLHQSQKMEAIGTLAGGIAHDFNNILSAVFGFTEMSIAKVPKGSALEKNLSQVIKAAHRARELVRQILTFSHQTIEEARPTYIQSISKEVIKLMRATLPSTIEIKSRLNTKTYVAADPTQIHQVMMNLLTNAWHAMESEYGIIQMELADVNLVKGALLSCPDLPPGKYVCLLIEDNGIGMPSEVVGRIFEPFFSTKEVGKGTGMGLSVVRGIVERCRGGIAVDSTPGKGTSFRVYFPAAEVKSKSEQAAMKKIRGGTEKLLIVDDESLQTEMAKEMLKNMGYTVTTQNDSMKALHLVKENKEAFNMVITDMTMPKMTGRILAKEIHEINPDLPIVLCSGYSGKMSPQDLISHGIRRYLMKPIGMHDLARTVREVLDENGGHSC